ncbi:hypothetical protein ACO0K9_18585 [Undibacterium sp. Ji50W]|uniref:hypothetical protein n=1 Tax=Undibacterium sp. Ji50W TaxID=3413041 RepID=UPI003BF43DD3
MSAIKFLILIASHLLSWFCSMWLLLKIANLIIGDDLQDTAGLIIGLASFIFSLVVLYVVGNLLDGSFTEKGKLRNIREPELKRRNDAQGVVDEQATMHIRQPLKDHFRKMRRWFKVMCWSVGIFFILLILSLQFQSTVGWKISGTRLTIFHLVLLIAIIAYLMVFAKLSRIVKQLGKSQIIWVWGPLICTNGLGIFFCYGLIQKYNPEKIELAPEKQFNLPTTGLESENKIKTPMSFSKRFFLLFAGLAAIAAARGFIESSNLENRLSSAVAACHQESAQNIASLELVGKSGKITQTIVVKDVGKFVFPIGMHPDEIWSAIRDSLLLSEGSTANTRSSNENWNFFPISTAISAEEKAIAFRLLRKQGELKSIYEIFDVNGINYTLEGPLGATRNTLISTFRPFFGTDSWCDLWRLHSNVNTMKKSAAQEELFQANEVYFADSKRKDIDKSYTGALILLAFGIIIPAIWYFLKRLRESAAAVLGGYTHREPNWAFWNAVIVIVVISLIIALIITAPVWVTILLVLLTIIFIARAQ